VRFALSSYFGFEEEIYALLEQRIREATDPAAQHMMECDGCKYREFSADHGQGGHVHDHPPVVASVQ
jgi:sirohydrochlorin cobaltochelatase